MKVVRPVVITDAALISTSVPENDYPEWSAGTLSRGARRIVVAEHTVYEVVATTTTDAPLAGVAADPPTWIEIGPTNRWRAFDEKVATATERAGEIAYTLQPGVAVDAVGFFALHANSVRVIVTDPIVGIVYDESSAPVRSEGVASWHDYFFEPLEMRRDFVLGGLGATRHCTIDIFISRPSGTASVGAIVLGKFVHLGAALHGTSVGITDYSRKMTDEFGNHTVVRRGFSKIANFQIALNTRDIARIQRALADCRATPVIWIGADDKEETLVYGFYREFDIVISGPIVSDANISVEGLI